MAAAFQFEYRVEFLPEYADEILRQIPAAPGVFALRGEAANSEPYLTRTADLRRRLRRLLAPPEAVDDQGRPVLSRRLNLREKVRWIEYTRTGSDFESSLVLYCATREAFGPEQARKRLRLHAPFFLRITLQHEHPRVYTTNKLSARSIPESFGPFPSRAAAERYCDAVLDLFKLRRCHEDLQVHPEHPGCAYGEMKKCIEPCKAACTAEDYAAEAARVHAFFATRGESLLTEVAQQREAASEAMDFEQAAALHKQWERVKAAALLADELVRPVAQLRAIILQEAAPHAGGQRLEEAAVFLLEHGRIAGPERLSTLGVRAVREQTAVGSSLFAQPLMLAPIPLDEPTGTLNAPTPNLSSRSEAKEPASGTTTNLSSRPDLAPSLSSRPDLAPNLSSRPDLAPNLSSRPERSVVERSQHLLSLAPSAELSSRPEVAHFATAAERSAANPAPNPPALESGAPVPQLIPEDRARYILAQLTTRAAAATPTIPEICDYLALFRRWYYRPEKQRTGEVFLPNPDATWPIRRILNGAARIVLGPPNAAAPIDREAAKALKTKVIHEGREGVERLVPVLPKRPRTRTSTAASEHLDPK